MYAACRALAANWRLVILYFIYLMCRLVVQNIVAPQCESLDAPSITSKYLDNYLLFFFSLLMGAGCLVNGVGVLKN